MPPRRRKIHGLYYHSSPPRVLPMNNPMSIKAKDERSGGKEAIVIKPSNIRIWIHDKDIGKLTKVLWEGYGMKLRTETSSNPKVKKFLESIPYITNLIKDIHSSVIDNDLDSLKSKTQPPVPSIVLSSKDSNGLTPLHKAAGLAHTRLVEYLLSIWPAAAGERDATGRTPLHYAASAKNNDRCFNLLVQSGSDETLIDTKNRNAAFYKHKPNDLDRSFLTVIPEAPRISQQSIPVDFDWSIIGDENLTTTNPNLLIKPSKIKPSFHSENNISSMTEGSNAITSPLKTQNSYEKLRAGNLSSRSLHDNLDNTSEPDINIETPETTVLQGNDLENNPDHENEDDYQSSTVIDKNVEDLEMTHPSTLSKLYHRESANDLNGQSMDGNDNTNGYHEDENNNHELYHENETGDMNENNNDSNNNEEKQTSDLKIDHDEKGDEYNQENPENESPKEIEIQKTNEDRLTDDHDQNDENQNDGKEVQVDRDDTEDDNDDNKNENNNNDIDTETDNENEHDNYNDDHEFENDVGSNIDQEENHNEKEAEILIIDQDENEMNDEVKAITGSTETIEQSIDTNHNNDEVENNASTKSSTDDDADVIDHHDIDSNNETEMHDKESIESPSPAMEIKGIVEGEPTEIGQLQSQGGILSIEDEDARFQAIIDSGDMEQLATLVLNGKGAKLVGMTSNQPEIQAFLDNVTAYMNKIRKVHLAAREGNLRELQSALDRRKFAIAKDGISPNGATPLHVAALFGHSGIVRYLGGRFPETTSTVDDNERTALHYAATIHDNGHFYNLLVHLGANPKVVDNQGNTPEFYLNHSESEHIMSHRKLLKDYGAEEEILDEMLNDQVPDDQHSARRLLDDADILSTLERCFKLIHEPFKQGHSLELPSNSVPGNASSLRISVTTYLARFLKRSVFDKIKLRQTRLDHNLFDIIWPAMKKITKERRIDEDLNVGVVIPDFDVYVVFQEFLVPLIKDIHCIDVNQEFHPHPKTNYFPTNKTNTIQSANQRSDPIIIGKDNSGDLTFELDLSRKYILSGLVECSRNLENFELPLNLNIAELEQAERVLTEKLLTIEFSKSINTTELGVYYTMNEVLDNPSEIRTVLATQGFLIPLLDNNDESQASESIAINGQFWPYGRGVYVSNSGDMVAWINVQEHLRVICNTPTDSPSDLGQPYSICGKAINFLESKIPFRHSYFLGNLASRPSFLGTSLRLTYTLQLSHLIKEKENLRHLCTMRGLHLKTSAIEKDLIRICNMQSMGVTEWKIFQDFIIAIANILQLEKDLSLTSAKNIAATLVNIFRKKKNNLN